jgi:hypothetical protein
VTPVPRLDHLVVAAASLDAGVALVGERLGVELEPGGRHERYGTHNALLSLGPTAYLEVIAADPDAASPHGPRWFELDQDEMRARLAVGPQLVHWVVAVGSLVGADPVHGDVVELSRGPNRWALTVPPDGALPMGGVLPSLIDWHTTPPAGRLPDRGVRLEALTLGTPEADLLSARVDALDLPNPPRVVEAPGPSLRAVLRAPAGAVTL